MHLIFSFSVFKRYAVFLLLGLLPACQPSPEAEEPTTEQLAGIAATVVQIKKAAVQPFQYRIEQFGQLEMRKQPPLSFAQGGLLARVLVKNGQPVAGGQLLAVLDTTLLAASYATAQAQVKQANEEFVRLKATFDIGSALSEEMLRKLEYRSGLAVAQNQLHQMAAQLRQAYLYAPHAGTVAGLSVVVGQAMAAGQPVCQLSGSAALWVRVALPQTEAHLLALPAQRLLAQFRPIAYQGKAFTARLAEADKSILNGMFTLWFAPDSLPQVAVPGQSVEVTVKALGDSVLVAPRESVVVRSGKEVIFTVKDGRAYWHYVTTGLENDTEIEVKEGLEPTDSVIVSNHLQLVHDTPVEAVK